MKKANKTKMMVLVLVILGVAIPVIGCGGGSSTSVSGAVGGVGAVGVPSTKAVYIDETSGGGGNPADRPATVRVFLTDAPNPAIDSAEVTISDVTVHKTGGAWFSVMEGEKKLDLLDLQNGVTELLGELELEPGKYTQFRFAVTDGSVGSGEDTFPVIIPSGKIKLNRNIEICSGGEFEIVIDFDAEKSLKYNKGQDAFKMTPVVKVESVTSVCPEEPPAEGTDDDSVEEYTGPLGWFSIVLPPIDTAAFASLTALIDDIQVHDQGIGQVRTFESSYTADLLEESRQIIDDETGEALYTVLVPPVEIPAGLLDQIRLFFQSIEGITADGGTVSAALPSGEEGDGLKFFGAIEVCEGGLTILQWDLALPEEGALRVHPEMHGPTLIAECEPFEP